MHSFFLTVSEIINIIKVRRLGHRPIFFKPDRGYIVDSRLLLVGITDLWSESLIGGRNTEKL